MTTRHLHPISMVVDKRNHIKRLPVELLTIIFELADSTTLYKEWRAQVAAKAAAEGDGIYSISPKRPIPPTPFRPPHNLANVCQLWNDVLVTLPQCWSKPFIYLDSDPREALSDLELSLKHSKDLPLDVTVEYSKGAPKDAEYLGEEKVRTRAIINVLEPHFHRCQHIEFRVVKGSSLPSVSLDLSSVSPTLRSLTLQCAEDDEDPTTHIVRRHGPSHNPASRPKTIENLYLSGYTIADACVYTPYLIHAVQNALTFSTYEAKGGHNGAAIVPYFLRSFTTLVQSKELASAIKQINLESIHLPFYASDDMPVQRQLWASTNLRDVGYNTMRNLLNYVDVSLAGHLLIQQSPLPDGFILPNVENLTLDEVTGDIPDALSEWDGFTLKIRNYPLPLDALLYSLAERREASECIMLEELTFNECTDFSPKAMKVLCKSRIPRDDDYPLISRHLERVNVEEIGPMISDRDREWFQKGSRTKVHWTTWMVDSKTGKHAYSKFNEDRWDSASDYDHREDSDGAQWDFDSNADSD